MYATSTAIWFVVECQCQAGCVSRKWLGRPVLTSLWRNVLCLLKVYHVQSAGLWIRISGWYTQVLEKYLVHCGHQSSSLWCKIRVYELDQCYTSLDARAHLIHSALLRLVRLRSSSNATFCSCHSFNPDSNLKITNNEAIQWLDENCVKI